MCMISVRKENNTVMKKALAVFAALLMVFCKAGCDSGNKPAQTEAVTTTADPDSVEVPDFSGLTRIQIEMKYPKLNIVFDEKYDLGLGPDLP